MKNFVVFFIIVFVFAGCQTTPNNEQVTINAKGFADSTMLYIYDFDKESDIDSGYVVNDELIFSIECSQPSQYILHTGFQDWENHESLFFWKEDGPLQINAEKQKLKEADVKGSEMQRQMDVLKSKTRLLESEVDSLWQVFDFTPDSVADKKHAIHAQIGEIREQINEFEMDFIRSHPSYLYAGYMLSHNMISLPNEETEGLFEGFSPEIKASDYGKRIEKFLEISRDIHVGDEAVDFVMPDLDGNEHRISDYKGKYVLLGFWSSGCGGCVMENPTLVENYEKYNDKGFEIVTVFLDKKRERWQNAVEEFDMTWVSVSDSQGFDGDAAMIYKIQYVPKTYLLDKEGVIIAEDIRGHQLGAKLEEIFAN